MDPAKVVIEGRLETNPGWLGREAQGRLDVRRLFCRCCSAPFLSKLGGGACGSGGDLGQGSNSLEGHTEQRKYAKGLHGDEMRDNVEFPFFAILERMIAAKTARCAVFMLKPKSLHPMPISKFRVRLAPFLRPEQSVSPQSEACIVQNQHHRGFNRRPTSLPRVIIGTRFEP